MTQEQEPDGEHSKQHSKELQKLMEQYAYKKTFIVEMRLDKNEPENSAILAEARLRSVSGVRSVVAL